MTEVAVRGKKNTIVQKMVDVVKPQYMEKAFANLEPLQYVNNEIVVSQSRTGQINKKLDHKIAAYIIAGMSTLTPITSGLIFALVTSLGIPEITSPVSGSITLGLFLSIGLISIRPIYFFDPNSYYVKLDAMYREDIKNWLHSQYGITVDDHNLWYIVNRIIISETNPLYFTDQTTGYTHILQVNSESNTWQVVKVNSQPAANISELPAPETTDNAQIDETLSAVNKKIDTLKEFHLTAEDAHLFTKAVNDAHSTVNLVKQLQKLGDIEYSGKAEQALKLIESDLDKIIRNQKKNLSIQFRAQQETILSRA